MELAILAAALLAIAIFFIFRRPKAPEVPAHVIHKSAEWWGNEARRFRLAYEQCEKGPERKAELRRRLEIAEAGLALAQKREEA